LFFRLVFFCSDVRSARAGARAPSFKPLLSAPQKCSSFNLFCHTWDFQFKRKRYSVISTYLQSADTCQHLVKGKQMNEKYFMKTDGARFQM